MNLKNQLNQLYQQSDSQQKPNPFLQADFDKFGTIEEEEDGEGGEAAAAPSDPIGNMCHQLSQELSALSATATNNVSSDQVSCMHKLRLIRTIQALIAHL